jgi:cytochrome c peroxidase
MKMLNKRIWKRSWAYVSLVCLAILLSISTETLMVQSPALSQVALIPKEQLGKSVMFDEHLSLNKNMQCVSCHLNKTGWTGQDEQVNAHGASYLGSVRSRSGNRKPQSLAYATYSPPFQRDNTAPTGLVRFMGGNFWDGRATGTTLGSPTAEQAQGPPINPLEMGLPDLACVVYRVTNPENRQQYPVSYQDVWGNGGMALK